MWYLDSEIDISEDISSPATNLFRPSSATAAFEGAPAAAGLAAKLADGAQGAVCLFGTVPPRSNLTMARVEQYADRLAATIRQLRPDGVIVYEIQEEEGRDGNERPFAYATTHPPRQFAKMIGELADVESIVYRTVAYYPKEGFEEWLMETWDHYNAKALVLVGGRCSFLMRMNWPCLSREGLGSLTRD